MNKPETLQQLEAMGTAQSRKVYTQHGVKGQQYGVSVANLKKLKNKSRLTYLWPKSYGLRATTMPAIWPR